MADFFQNGRITTLHDLGTVGKEHLEHLLDETAEGYQLGLILPVTAADMRAAPFAQIMQELRGASYVKEIVVVLNVAPEPSDYRETKRLVEPLGETGRILWCDGKRVQALYTQLIEAGIDVSVPGKGRAVWTAYGYLLGNPRLKAFVLHDCDIVDYDRELLARLCLPMAHSGLDFEFCKAYYARCSQGRMYGRVARLLVTPLLRALTSLLGPDRFLLYLDSFRYPLSGEFAVTSTLARSMRVPSDWGLEIGTLAEVYRKTSINKVCQVDLAPTYEHKHSPLSLDRPEQGLMKMATDILCALFRTLASTGVVLESGHFVTLRSAYLLQAQDAIRQYHADAVLNGLAFDRHDEEQAVEGFAERITAAGETFRRDPLGVAAIPNLSRVLSAFPDFPRQLRAAVRADAAEHAAVLSG